MTATIEAPVAAPATPSDNGHSATAKPAVKKAAPKKKAAAKKAPAKKSAKKAPKAKKPAGERKERGPSKLQISVLKKLASRGPLTRAELSKALDGAFIGGNVMGHVDPKRLHPSSLLGRELVRMKIEATANDGQGPASYEITAKGKKALEG